ncbi:hypothetical protein L202_01287 [Cryptococcus amylolentus CBS 6039]|uniref:PUM-HD domain-containing protein n=1 Tax=Cryptococcus amylolentus CBS 6039 TaxID=1295533 RepID=A0A1E3I3A2_9TREE|nr:hypothetical protein L202_01287 [Cryptococcus amylolentus CBS 6039]ODN83062.1 hypothetical protein L202_01287 [Cryptococcus amylolentus CBS 6039]
MSTFHPFSPWMSHNDGSGSSRPPSGDKMSSSWAAPSAEDRLARSTSPVTSRFLARHNSEHLTTLPLNHTSWDQPLSRSLDNAQNEILPPKFSSPLILPGLDVGPWSPPIQPHWRTEITPRPPFNHHLEEKLAIADAQIRQLTLDNKRLREYIIHNPAPPPIASPAILTPASEIKSFFSSSTNYDRDARSRSKDTLDGKAELSSDDASPSGEISDDQHQAPPYTAPPVVVHSVLQGTFNFAAMPPQLIRAIVWTLAYCQPKNNHESAGLKTAVKALTTRFGVTDTSDPSSILTRAIIEWAKPLCYTSCGNYLCQQLLERGNLSDKKAFLDKIWHDIVPIASNKFGTHVLCKAINLKELEEPVAEALFKHGAFESMQTGTRRLWREYLEKCRQAKKLDVFDKINLEMAGRWAQLACVNEIVENISMVSNNQYGHFVVTKLVSFPSFYKQTCEAIINSYPPVATTHHGVNLAKIALTEGGRASFARYVEAICKQDEGRTPGIVTIATSSIGKAHLTFVLSCLTPSEHIRIRTTCRAYCITLRNCQSGNDLLRALGIMHSSSTKHRASNGL